jgi:NADH dehydrogenase (ubiquinone) 1 alpha subcomplex subunit 5
MRSTLRLFAKVKPSRYLEPFAPTGLTGLQTHPSPRPTLIYLYTTTLEKLKAFPESSAYRKSTEALTRHRLQIIVETKPPGFDEWLARVKETVAAEPHRFAPLRRSDGTFAAKQTDDGSADPRGKEWDGEGLEPTIEGPARTPEEEARFNSIMEEAHRDELKESDFATERLTWENEPALEADQYVH